MTATLFCAVCLYVQPRPDLTDEDLAETSLLTIKSGILVCERHVGCVPDDRLTLHSALNAAVQVESRGEFDNLSAYQDWRFRQQEAN